MKIILIAEKPSVGRTYAQALDLENEKKQDGYIEGHSKWDGNDYVVTWSFGHLVTLCMPIKYGEQYKNWNMEDLPLLPNINKYKYEVIASAAKQFNIVKKLYNDPQYSVIVYGGDSGREGLYIQMLIRQMAGNNGHVTEKVLWIDSQTEEEIRKGLQNMKPLSAYTRLIHAGYVRAMEDYAFGINYSRALSIKFGKKFNSEIKSDKWKTISVGRVMTCVLAMIVNKEREIKNFKETSFYKIYSECSNGKFEFSVDWVIDKNSKYIDSPLLYYNKGFKDIEKANEFVMELSQDPKLIITAIEEKTEKKRAPLLFNLAELQNECSKRFKISPSETLEVVQKLYESQLTTYPRTDARYLTTAICKELVHNLEGLKSMGYNTKFIDQILTFGTYSGLEKTQYCNDSKVTDHYAIIPTGKGSVSGLSELELNVYHMIVNRFICIFMPSAEYNVSVATLKASNEEIFRITEKSLVKTGFLEVVNSEKKPASEEVSDEAEEITDGVKLSDYIKEGDVFDAEFFVEEGKTTPPKPYTTGSLILAMENAGTLIEDEELRAQIKSCGIGTSATRAEIIAKLVRNGYITVNKKTQKVAPHEDGTKIIDLVSEYIPALTKPEMTASWEKGLSMIENGETTKEDYMNKLEKEIRRTVERIAAVEVEEPKPFLSEETKHKCPYCGETIMTASNGFKCKMYKKTGGCPFYVSTIAGLTITEEILMELLSNGITSKLKGFKKKSGSGTFEAKIRLNKEEKKLEFDFS